MTHQQIEDQLKRLIKTERKITNEILRLINLAFEEKIFLERGYDSMFEWLVKGFGYSNAAAFRRTEAARLLRSVPSITQKLEDGLVNLSTITKVATAVRAHERNTGKKVTTNQKAKLVDKIENKSGAETDLILISEFPDIAPAHEADKRVVIDENKTRHSMTLSKQATSDLNRAKEVLSHKFPFATDSEIVAYALQFLLEETDPLRHTASAAEVERPTKISLRKATYRKSKAACTYRDPKTGKVCGSKYQVQIDHIIPKALGGTDDPANLRCLCGKHNRLMAKKILGYDYSNSG